MVAEVLEHLAPERGGVFIDCTVGLGGHARALLEAGASRVIGLDRDPSALERSRDALAAFSAQVELVHADYRELPDLLDARSIGGVDGVLADLGVSSLQLDAPDAAGRIPHVSRLPLDPLAPGTYELRVRLRQGSSTALRTLQFRVVP